MTVESLRAGVVGVGAIGQHHARIYSELADVDLVGLYDTDEQRARVVAERYGTQTLPSLEALLERVDLVSVAVPTPEHHRVGMQCLGAGVDLLLEKPIAVTLAQADALVSAATERSCILQVGHVERYNPAVEAVLAQVQAPRFIEIHRLGSFVPRSLDVDVVVDLMIHDLDIMHALVPGLVGEIRAVGVAVLSEEIDIANARLEMDSGCIVNMTASRVSMTRVRKVRIFQAEAYFSVDYANQQVACYRLERPAGRPASISGVPVAVEATEPLRNELLDFIRCVRDRSIPRVDGAAGRRALRTALRIRDLIAEVGSVRDSLATGDAGDRSA